MLEPTLTQDPSALSSLAARVDELERSRALWEAEAEAALRRATAEKQIARNAEERTRAMAKKLGDGDDDGEEAEWPEGYQLPDGDAAPVPAGEMYPMQRGMGATRGDRAAAARAYKFAG